MRIDCEIAKFKVAPTSKGDNFDLAKQATKIEALSGSKSEYKDKLDEFRLEITQLQSILYASATHALLVIFQGMDTAGKGGAIKHVLSGVNPQGCHVVSFGPPTNEELGHDFLWRISKRLPERGQIGIFDRSYYEDVVVARVHPEVLAKQRIPSELMGPKLIWQQRYEDINNWELYLQRNGIKIVKVFLHLSFEEQRKRLLQRIDDPSRNWKFSMADLDSRRQWPKYQQVWEECLIETSTNQAPWYVVPADSKKNARLIVSKIILEALESLQMNFPQPTKHHLSDLQKAREVLESEDSG